MALGFKLCLITDRRMVAAQTSLVPAVEEALAGGVDAVQLREKDLAGRELYQVAVAIREATVRCQAKFFVNDRIDVAIASGADGVQLPGDSFPPTVARKLMPRPAIIGVSVHSLAEARSAVADGADFVMFGPIFDTPSKRRFGKPQGLEQLKRLSAGLAKPVVAVGGINPANVGEVIGAGASGVACISSLLAVGDYREAARRLVTALS